MSKKLSIIGFTLLFILTGCQQQSETPAAKIPAVAIDVAPVLVEEVQPWHTYTTRLEAPERVTLMPRVSGVVEKIAFTEGQQVAQGEVLFQIDPRPFQAEVSRLQAQIFRAQAALEQAQNREKRALNLGQSSAISEEQIENRSSDTKQRQAELLALQAQLDAAQLNLDFTTVRSPINGLISRAEITKGNNVTADESVLSTIISDNNMYAYFNIDERTWNADYHNVSAADHLPVVLELAGNNELSFQGELDFVDPAVNPSTGTLRVRATFNDHNGELRAGSFARIRLPSSTISSTILVPDRAIGTDLKNRFVLTVSADNQLEYRQVETGERYGQFRAVTQGLNRNDIIAVNGPAKVGPGMVITPRPVELDTTNVTLTTDDYLRQQALVTAQTK